MLEIYFSIKLRKMFDKSYEMFSFIVSMPALFPKYAEAPLLFLVEKKSKLYFLVKSGPHVEHNIYIKFCLIRASMSFHIQALNTSLLIISILYLDLIFLLQNKEEWVKIS